MTEANEPTRAAEHLGRSSSFSLTISAIDHRAQLRDRTLAELKRERLVSDTAWITQILSPKLRVRGAFTPAGPITLPPRG